MNFALFFSSLCSLLKEIFAGVILLPVMDKLADPVSNMCKYSCNLTLKHRETHGCVVSTVAIDALVLKHQAISIHNAD